MVAHAQDQPHVVVDEEDRHAVLLRQGPQPAPQLEALVGVQARRGLVEQDQPGLAGQRPADAHQLALAQGDLRRVAVDDILQAADRDGPVDAGPVRRAVRQEQVAQRRGDGHVLAGHEQVLVDREVVEQLDRLEGPGQAEARPPVGAQAPDVAAPELDPPGGGPGVAGQGVDHRGLARTVRADQPVDGALRDLQVDVGHGHDPAVGDAQAGDVQQRRPRGRCGHRPPTFT